MSGNVSCQMFITDPEKKNAYKLSATSATSLYDKIYVYNYDVIRHNYIRL